MINGKTMLRSVFDRKDVLSVVLVRMNTDKNVCINDAVNRQSNQGWITSQIVGCYCDIHLARLQVLGDLTGQGRRLERALLKQNRAYTQILSALLR